MKDDHPSLETLARWLAGELDHERVLRELAPHFLESCTVCHALREEIDRLLQASGHWDETVAVLESREAPELLALLDEGTHTERMRRADETEELHTWGVCQLLLENVRELVFSDPVRAVETAHLAVRMAGHLGASYHPDWVLELRARTHAHLGNARRVLGELQAAEDSFLLAIETLERSGNGNPGVEAEILSLKGSLRLDQRRLEEALDLVARAGVLYREADNPAGVAKALLQKSKILNQRGDVEAAITALRTASSEIDRVQEPALFARARHGLLFSLTLASRFEEAAEILPEVQTLYEASAGTVDWLRLRWTEGNIVQGLGQPAEAEAAYRSVRREFLGLGKGLDAPLVSLDLAYLLWEQGRTEELKELAGEMMVIFESREIHREALASLLLFQQACAEERLTGELIRGIAGQLRREGKA